MTGFHEARRQILDCLGKGRISHWPREDAFRKNWLDAKRITPEELRVLLSRCSGIEHQQSPHHFDADTTVHVFTPHDGATRWYIKVYYDEDLDSAVFMSVHPSGK